MPCVWPALCITEKRKEVVMKTKTNVKAGASISDIVINKGQDKASA
jgi:hypothetical protein